MNYCQYRQIEQRLVVLARERGLNGSPYGTPTSRPQRLYHPFAAECLVLDAGFYERLGHEEKRFARKLAESIVASSTSPSPSAPPKTKRRRRGAR